MESHGAHDRPARTAPRGSPVEAAGVLFSLGLATKATGFLRVAAVAALLGAGPHGDAFLTAFLLPEVLYIWFTEGGMTGALVRILGTSPSQRTLIRLLLGTGALGLALAAAVVLAAGPLAEALAPGFRPEVRALARGHLVTLAPYVPLTLVYFVLQAALNARGHFWGPALGPLAFNVAILVAAARAPGPDSAHLTAGVLLGGLLQCSCAAVPALALLRLPSPRSALTAAPWLLRRVLHLTVPTGLLVTFMQVQFVVERVLLSEAQAGTVTRFATAQKFVVLPLGLVAVSLATAFMPYLVRRHVEAGVEGVRAGLRVGVRTLVWLMVPATSWMAAGALPIVTLVFGRGEFVGADLRATAAFVEVAAPCTVLTGLSLFLVRGYLAIGDARAPALIKGAATVGLLGLDALLVGHFGGRALFLLAAGAALLECGVLLGHLPGARRGDLGVVLGELARAALAGAAWVLAFRLVGVSATEGSAERVLALLPASLAGLAAFAAVARLVGAPAPRRLLADLRSLRASRAGPDAEDPHRPRRTSGW